MTCRQKSWANSNDPQRCNESFKWIRKRKEKTFSHVLRDLSYKVTHELSEGNYHQWTKSRVTELNKDYIGIPYPISETEDLNNYNDFVTFQKSSIANGKNYSLSYLFKAKELNGFDNTYRVSLLRYAQEWLLKGRPIHESLFDKIWTRREYQERFKHIGSLKSVHVACWRSGVVPFYRLDGIIYFGFAHDTTSILKSGGKSLKYNLCDFGGGIEIGESTAMAAIREWSEESLGLFPRYSISPETIVSVYHGVVIYFVDITSDQPPEMELGRESYQFPGNISLSIENVLHKKLGKWRENHIKPNNFPEVGGLSWFNSEEIDNLLICKEEEQTLKFYETIIPNIININRIEKIIARQ